VRTQYAHATRRAGSQISKKQKTIMKRNKEIKALTKKAIDKPTKKRQAICGLREGLREGERVANLFSLPY